MRLNILAANPEKDFQQRLTIRWSAAELIVIAGNRLRTFLDLHFKRAPERLAWTKMKHDPRDRFAAEKTLRAVLPSESRTVSASTRIRLLTCYVTHSCSLATSFKRMNRIMSDAVVGLAADDVPEATGEQVVDGVYAAEKLIVSGILTTYW